MSDKRTSKNYQLDVERGVKREIEMPPLPQEESQPVDQKVDHAQPVEHYENVQTLPSETIQEKINDDQYSEDHVEEVVEEKPKSASQSFREIREAKEKAERERNELMIKMQKLQQDYIDKMQQPAPAPEPDDSDLDIDPEALVEGKHLKKYIDQMRDMRKEINTYKQQSKELVLENKLKSKYPDFNEVFNLDNVNKLNEKYPSIAEGLSNISDDFKKAEAAYEIIKNLNIVPISAKDNVSSRTADDKARAQANAAKPRPLVSASPQQGDSPLSKANAFANGLTKDLKDQLRKEMYAAMRNN